MAAVIDNSSFIERHPNMSSMILHALYLVLETLDDDKRNFIILCVYVCMYICRIQSIIHHGHKCPGSLRPIFGYVFYFLKSSLFLPH